MTLFGLDDAWGMGIDPPKQVEVEVHAERDRSRDVWRSTVGCSPPVIRRSIARREKQAGKTVSARTRSSAQ